MPRNLASTLLNPYFPSIAPTRGADFEMRLRDAEADGRGNVGVRRADVVRKPVVVGGAPIRGKAGGRRQRPPARATENLSAPPICEQRILNGRTVTAIVRGRPDRRAVDFKLGREPDFADVRPPCRIVIGEQPGRGIAFRRVQTLFDDDIFQSGREVVIAGLTVVPFAT